MSLDCFLKKQETHFQRAAAGHNATLLEANQLIQEWVEDVKVACSHGDDLSPQPARDFLSTVDWCDGDTGTSAKVIVQGLMSKNLGISEYKVPSSKSCDPSVAMEMRHMKVRERRVARDKKRTKAQTRMTLANEARLKAEELVLMEEKMFKEQRRKEDRLISDHMKQMRMELRERQLVFKQTQVTEPFAMNNAVEQANEFIKSEKRRQHTRRELLRQLEEAQAVEVKNNIKLLHTCFSQWLHKAATINDWKLLARVWEVWRRWVCRCRAKREQKTQEIEVKNNFKLLHSCFSRWFQVLIKGHGKLLKAATINDWKLLARVWGVWRGWVSHCRVKREQQEVTRQMQRQRLLFQRACDYDSGRLLIRVFRAWMSASRQSRNAQRERQVQLVYKRKMDALLLTAAQRVQTLECIAKEQSCPVESKHELEDQRPVEYTPEPNKPPRPSEPILWKQAEQEMQQLVKQVETVSHSTSTEKRDVTFPLRVKRSKPQTTKPIPMSGMEMRSQALAQRKVSRMERRRTLEHQKVEALVREKEEEVLAELEEKRVRKAKIRAELLATKKREQEKEECQRTLSTLMSKAALHYQLAQLKMRGVAPWTRFMEVIREAREKANGFSNRTLTKKVFGLWKLSTACRLSKREMMATEFRIKTIIKRAMRAWREYVCQCRSMEDFAASTHLKILSRCVFHSWMRVTREERIMEWEMLMQTRRLRERCLKQRVLSCWMSFVPLAKEEKAHEARKAVLRQKVASWLHDYSPANPTLPQQ